MKAFFQKYRHALVLLYGLIYMPWFMWLESRSNLPYHVIHVKLDDMIPFVEYFIVPYLLWFVYVAAVFVYLFFKNRREFYQYCIFLFTGMTLFLIVSTLYPNGHLLRPNTFARNNIFTFAVQILYQADTATNIFPSLHVYNSIAAHRAVANSETLAGNRLIRGGSFVLMVSIILATMFLKQHSVLDVISGILLGLVMEQLVYRTDYSAVRIGWGRKRKPEEAA
ncbi:MAG TPA: phosphatase PAP2 family protein [Candidatus Merdisoma faecalis]|uniref:phosphatase PAP2 family protein n=1 Tax=Lachnoclostridium sp. An138 TaxID=1965560 RepID=UPI000B39E0EB|nr:phosphatase PAP2 family protein [Lachnoclostridium sp. An138]OUQ16311.1 phosphoesterase [Lachnoclostridium sp. An138]HIR97668.1 phosphatase PAP2 family protein [Candidatus Merdisoma faecalis]